ncbi:MAG: hypothetical protein P8X58_03975 [Syntrophobacterales bacterium]
MKQVEQGHRVGSPGHRHQDPRPRREQLFRLGKTADRRQQQAGVGGDEKGLD